MKLNFHKSFCAVSVVMFAHVASAAIVFDDFNLNEGHFSSNINFSGTTVGEDAAASTAERITTDSIEGGGSQHLHLVHDATADPYRLRHVSGVGSPANNISFTITEGVDGFIGFYIKTTATGWETSINLDVPGNSGAQMVGARSVSIIGDGEWHLYEWDLESTSDWVGVPAISSGPGGTLPLGTYTIDSIYFRDLDGSPGPDADIYIDFVAKSDSGSVAELIPEPSSSLLAVAGGVGLMSRIRRRRSS